VSNPRPSNDLISRWRRFASRSGSSRELTLSLLEELVVHAWSHEPIRMLGRPILRSNKPENWIFLVGCYNSGTTLLQKILGAHPGIAALPREGVRFTSVLSDLETRGHHMMWDEGYADIAEPEMTSEVAVKKIHRDWSLFIPREISYVLDKSVANTARIQWLSAAFPNARFIGIHRDGRCVAEGLRRRAQPPEWLRNQTGSDRYPIMMTAAQWRIANECLIDQIANVQHSMLVRFEDLVADPLITVREILAFLDLSDEAVSSNSDGLVVASKRFAVRDPNPTSLKRLSKSDLTTIEQEAGDMMRHFGYSVELEENEV